MEMIFSNKEITQLDRYIQCIHLYCTYRTVSAALRMTVLHKLYLLRYVALVLSARQDNEQSLLIPICKQIITQQVYIVYINSTVKYSCSAVNMQHLIYLTVYWYWIVRNDDA